MIREETDTSTFLGYASPGGAASLAVCTNLIRFYNSNPQIGRIFFFLYGDTTRRYFFLSSDLIKVPRDLNECILC